MTIVVTGTSGHLGHLVVEALLARDVPADQIIATARDVTKIVDLAERGVRTARADYADPASLREAFAGADSLVLVSSSEVGVRGPQHANAIDAAKAAGVSLIAYTSIPYADASAMVMAREHRETEKMLTASGVPFVSLRNGWYTENYTDQLPVYLARGIAGAAGDAEISTAPRADYAEAAAAVVTSDGHAGKFYELGGETLTMARLAEVVSAESGQDVTYIDLSEEAYAGVLIGAGLPEAMARALADADAQAAASGALHVRENHLETLIGRRPTPLVDVVRAALA